MTSSFEDAIKTVLGEETKAKVSKPKAKKEPIVEGGSATVVDRDGASVNSFTAFTKNQNAYADTNIMDIGKAEEHIAKTHQNPIFPLEQIPINIIVAGEKISDELVNIDTAIKSNKMLTDDKKKELKSVKNLIKTVLGNIRKAASMIDALQH